jgi:DUF4097 and DUF4098 domain-containing protein YvlB
MDEHLYESPAEIRHRIGATGTFSLTGISGDIRLKGNDGDEVIVRAQWEHGNRRRELPLNVRRTDGALHIDTDQRSGWFDFSHHGSIEFEASVPRNARVDITSVSGDIAAHDLLGDQVYKTVSGDLLVDGTGGRVSATSVSGDVQVFARQALDASLASTSGDLETDAPMFKPLRMKTVSGDMEVRGGFDAGPQHTVESVSGDLSIDSRTGLTVETKKGLDFSKKNKEPQYVGDGSAHLRFRSLSGDLDLTGPKPTRAGQAWGTPAPYPPVAPTPPAPPEPPRPPTPSPEDSLEILRALERGEIDVDEASRRLEGASRA